MARWDNKKHLNPINPQLCITPSVCQLVEESGTSREAFYYISCEMVGAAEREIKTFFGHIHVLVCPQYWWSGTSDLWWLSQRDSGWYRCPCEEPSSKVISEKLKLSTMWTQRIYFKLYRVFYVIVSQVFIFSFLHQCQQQLCLGCEWKIPFFHMPALKIWNMIVWFCVLRFIAQVFPRFFNVKGVCGSGDGAGRPLITRLAVWSLARLVCMSQCPWARHWTPSCVQWVGQRLP